MVRYIIPLLIVLGSMEQADGYGFRTPSTNIYCNGSMEGGDISCTIVERSSGPAAPRPASCTGNWGHTFSLDRNGPARIECNAHNLRPSRYSSVAEYGTTLQLGENTCQSESTGLTCRNARGHGFFLSRRSQQFY